jgi:uncharacterized protein
LRTASFYSRHGRLICVSVFILMPALLYGALGAFKSNTNNILDWLPESFEETQRLFEFISRFGSDEILVISWQGCTLEDDRLDRVAAELVKPVAEFSDGQRYPWFRKVFTGRDTLAELTAKPLLFSREEALHRMRGWLVGPDGDSTCVLALISEPGSMNRAGAIRYVREVLESAGVSWQEAHLGGPTANAVAIDEASITGIAPMAIGSALLGLVVAWKCLRSLRLVTIIMLSAVLAWSASLSMVYLSGTNMDAVLLMMPALVFVLTVSGAVHLTNYYSDCVTEMGIGDESLTMALRRGWLPCVLASLTTAFGLGSLLTSELIPVRKFGFFSSVSMVLIVAALLVYWPALVSCWPPRTAAPARASRQSHWWRPLYLISTRFPNSWLLLFLALLPLCGFGISQLKTSAQLQDLLDPHSAAIQSYKWLQERIGSLTPVEVELRFDRSAEDDAKTLLHRAEIVESLRTQILESPDVDGIIAATTFVPPLPASQSARDLLLRRVIAAGLEKHRDRLEELQFLHTDEDSQGWRISTRVNSLNLEYRQFLKQLNSLVESFVAEQTQAGTKVSAYVCGGVPLVYMAQEQLLKDLIKSFLLAFLLIALTMIVLTRSVLGGLLSMVPNVFPALAAFGTMGLLTLSVDIGTMMTASAAMGIAVDDTLHFLVWFRRGLGTGLPRRRAARFAFRHCATAMFQTSLICGVGLLVFMASPFAPIARFGLIMAIMLALGLVGDLVLLPATLCSSLGQKWGKNQGIQAGL